MVELGEWYCRIVGLVLRRIGVIYWDKLSGEFWLLVVGLVVWLWWLCCDEWDLMLRFWSVWKNYVLLVWDCCFKLMLFLCLVIWDLLRECLSRVIRFLKVVLSIREKWLVRWSLIDLCVSWDICVLWFIVGDCKCC